MGKRQREWCKRNKDRFRNLKLELIKEAGGRCIHPGCSVVDPANLEFHHRFTRKYGQHALGWYAKLYRIRKEIRSGQVTLLCKSHNASYGEPSDNAGASENSGIVAETVNKEAPF